MRKRILLAVTAGLMATLAHAVDQEQAEKAVDIRQSVLTVSAWNIGPMAAMAQEKAPYDAERFALHAERIAAMASMIPDAFRTDTREFPVETEALDGIWEDFDEFQELAEANATQARLAAARAREGSFADAQDAVSELGQSCKNCHDKFRED